MAKITREEDTNLISQGFIPTRKVKERYDVSDMTLWRWLNSGNDNFPEPYIFCGRKYWKLSELDEWERKAPRTRRVRERSAA